MAAEQQISTAPEPTTWRQELLDGIRSEAPLLLGVGPFGMVFGVLGMEAGLTPLQVFAMSSIIFGGASQIIFAQLAAVGTGGGVITATVGLVNLRHMLYSAAVSAYFSHLPMRWKLLLAYLLTDEAFVITMDRLKSRPASPVMQYHLLGTGLTLWTGWQLTTLAGIMLGTTIPESWGLSFAIPLSFIALILPYLRQLPHLAAALSAGAVGLFGQGLPYGSWVVAAALTGMAAGVLAEKLLGADHLPEEKGSS